jgi:hypothetical protein
MEIGGTATVQSACSVIGGHDQFLVRANTNYKLIKYEREINYTSVKFIKDTNYWMQT